MSCSQSLHEAKKAKDDEFYTLYEDIEKEVSCYPLNTWKGKVIYCNCDDPRSSNFWKYFVDNFHKLGLKALHATYKTLDNSSSWHWVFDGETALKQPLKSNGDFRSEECIEILKEADIVVTNPPFSLFREYTAQLLELEKSFLIAGKQTAITHKKFFPFIAKGKVTLGFSNRLTAFLCPDGSFQKLNDVVWYMNLTTRDIPFIELTKTYNSEEYKKYDNYDAINVNRTKDIPCDYDGVMGVPISFLHKHNPNQFQIIGLCSKGDIAGIECIKQYKEYVEYYPDGTPTGMSGSKLNGVAVLKGMPSKKSNYFVFGDDVIHALFPRIFIRLNKAKEN